jgi:hypothetical protein
MTIREDEKFCQEAFAKYLHDQYLIQGKWVPKPNGEKKVPDFHMHYGCLTYAVEVTGLMTQYEQSEGRPIPERGILESLDSLANEVEKEANKKGLLRGNYILTLDGPYDSFRISKKEIKKILLDFIAKTQCIDKVPGTMNPLATPSGQTYFLEKAGLHKNVLVGYVFVGDNEGWSSNVEAELSSLIQCAISSKANKLQNISPPWVLLLLDRHHLARAMEYAIIRDHLASPDFDSSTLRKFDSVYIINGHGQVFPLYPLDGGKWV